jgi:hypothetical protein
VNGSIASLSGLLLDLVNSANKLVQRNVVTIQIYLLLFIIITLTAALLCFAVMSLLITEYGYKSWESALLLAVILLGITIAIFALYKFFFKQKNENQFHQITNNSILKSKSNLIEQGATEVLVSLRKVFSFEELVGRNPLQSITFSSLFGVLVGYMLTGKKNDNLETITQNTSNQVTQTRSEENKNISPNSHTTPSQKSKDRITGLAATLFNMALPLILPAIEKKISFAVDALLNNTTQDKNRHPRAESSNREK